MAKKTLYQFYLDLIPNLLTDLMFYIPKREIGKDIIEKIDFFRDHDVLDKVFVFDEYSGPMAYDKNSTVMPIFLNSGKLQKNLFDLIEKRASSQTEAFQYILDRYFELVEFLFFSTDWMNTNLTRVIDEDDKTMGLFNQQYLNYKKHFEDLIRNFYPNRTAMPKARFNTQEIIDSYFPDISKSHSDISAIQKNHNIEKTDQGLGHTKKEQSTTTITTITPQQHIVVKGKTPLISEGEAEKHLLKTIFNIDENVLN